MVVTEVMLFSDKGNFQHKRLSDALSHARTLIDIKRLDHTVGPEIICRKRYNLWEIVVWKAPTLSNKIQKNVAYYFFDEYGEKLYESKSKEGYLSRQTAFNLAKEALSKGPSFRKIVEIVEVKTYDAKLVRKYYHESLKGNARKCFDGADDYLPIIPPDTVTTVCDGKAYIGNMMVDEVRLALRLPKPDFAQDPKLIRAYIHLVRCIADRMEQELLAPGERYEYLGTCLVNKK